jgi:C-terminal processing protease CtpA/Prc
MKITPGSSAAKSGMKVGDLVLEIAAQPVADCDVDAIWQILRDSHSDGVVTLCVVEGPKKVALDGFVLHVPR